MHEAEVRKGRSKPSNLRYQVSDNMKLWPTPRANEPGRTSKGYGRGLGELVEGREQLWLTPTARDYKGTNSMDGLTRNDGKSRMDQLPNAVKYYFPTPCTTGFSSGSHNCEKSNQLAEEGILNEEERRSFRAGNGGKLNPDWEEWLMGWVPGWTSLEPMSFDHYDGWVKRSYEGSLWDYDPAELPEDDEGYIPRTAKDIPQRINRIIAIGNGQVPQSLLLAMSILHQDLS